MTPTDVRTEPKRVRVELGARAYDVICGAGLLAEAGALIAPFCPRARTVIVTDETVAAAHLETLTRSLAAAGVSAEAIATPVGETSKSWRQLERVSDFILDAGLERGEPVIALGGGVIGDLAGLAAALYKRGSAYIQIPTTLLAQVDSSVGGKTAINTNAGKNLIGAFHQPALVIADIETLNTLDARDVRAGLAEVIKYGVIGDDGFFDWLEAHVDGLVSGTPRERIEAVARSVARKAAVVAEDERETGARALLNYGHTFAHAFEALAGYDSGLRHGEAVATGMAMAARYAERLGLISSDDAKRIVTLIKRFGLAVEPNDLPGAPFDPSRMLTIMRGDKKVVGGRLRLVLPRRIGEAEIVEETDENRLFEFLRGQL